MGQFMKTPQEVAAEYAKEAAVMSAERYWEERWRTEKAENDRLRETIKILTEIAERALEKIERASADK
jgi:hypothetical protein